MTTKITASLVGGLLMAGLTLGRALAPAAQTPPARHVVTDAEYQRWKTDSRTGAAGAKTTRSARSI